MNIEKEILKISKYDIRKYKMFLSLSLELELWTRKWRAGIDANRKHWCVENVKKIQSAGKEMYRLIDELEILREEK